MPATGRCPRFRIRLLAPIWIASAICLGGAGVGAEFLADSSAEWNPGVQFANSWAYGWRNLATHPNVYGVSHFQLFLNDGSGGATPVSQSGPNHWDGTAWDFGIGAPWTHLGQLSCHPNGFNNTGGEQWVIRRWSSETSQVIRIIWQLTDINPGGSGVTGRLFQEGAELGSFSTDGVTRDLVYYVDYQAGDRLDFAITPLGVDDSPSDMGDNCETLVLIDTEVPEDAMNPIGLVADSVADFTELQGKYGWYYGYYDQRLDVEAGNLIYEVSDFIPFLNDRSGIIASDPRIGAWKFHPNHWSGTQWDLFDQSIHFQGPWTYMSSEEAEPAANGQIDPSVHWAVRRWISEFDGLAMITGTLFNYVDAGDGVWARFFKDGVEYHSRFSNGTEVPFRVEVPVSEGSVLDFALDPDGSSALNLFDPTTLDDLSDTSDQSIFELQIEGYVAVVPEPSSLLLMVAAAATLSWMKRMRQYSSAM